ncbi:LEA type 2 family protein [Hymenobacter lapidarius]|uniref:LEA type 2 family protein n=1 Tax=Hymenobacter lapidarius TaxID=1908237 RepID=UPI000F7B3133|nr:LEA type 2 family protein [Hymenobacter lapidarius]
MKFTSYLYSVRAAALGVLLVTTTQCSVSDQVKESPNAKKSNLSAQALENQAFDRMQFRLNFMDEARLGGQDILFVRQATDLTSAQQTKLQTALQSNNLPLKLRMRIYARNPSAVNLQLKQLDYQILVDGRELTKGVTGLNEELEPSAIITLPVAVDFNVPAALLSGSTPAAFAANLADFTGSGRRLTMRIRPTYASISGRVAPQADFQPIELVTKKR